MIDKFLHNRWRFPRLVNRLIDFVADHPMSVIGQVVARRMGVPPKNDATPTSLADQSRGRSLLIAPVNYSGQGHSWARALQESTNDITATNMAIDVPGGFEFRSDLIVPVPVYHNGANWQRRQLEAVSAFSHVLIEAEEPLFGRLFGRDCEREARELGERGVDVSFMCHGTDIRLPSRHRNLTPWSPYLDSTFYTDRLERLALRHRELLERAGRPVFVSTPDLLADVEFAVWCPVTVDPEVWSRPEVAEREPGPLRVAHIPSHSFLKGTQFIQPVLRSLHSRGVIDYREIIGVPSAEMAAVLRDADVVLDQFRLGSYGVAACEAMAAGAAVVGHVMPEVRQTVTQATGRTLPIIEATPDTLEHVLSCYAQEPEALRTVQRDGVQFVAEVHDGTLSSKILRHNWIDRHLDDDADTEEGRSY